MKKILKKHRKLILIFLLALLLRTYKLGTIPSGFHADEVRVGWNAYSILNTGRDDRGNLLAFYYNTFGDYRPTGIIYIAIPSLLLFGINEFAVRFPSALLGALTIFPLYAFVNLLTVNTQKNNTLGLLAAFLLAISPWHIVTSRATSEVVISLFFSLSGLTLFLKGLNSENRKTLYLSFFLFLLSYLFYHSIRLIAPLFILGTFFYLWANKSELLSKRIAIIFFLSLSILTLLFMSNKEARGRFSQVSVAKDMDTQETIAKTAAYSNRNPVFDNPIFIYGSRFTREYLNYFSGEFLIGDSAKPIRYKTPGIGVLTYFEFAIFIIGFIVLIRKKNIQLPLLLLLISPLAAALTREDSPNLHRSLLMVPFITIIMSYGFYYLWSQRTIEKIITIFLFLGLSLNFFYFLQVYSSRAKFVIAPVRNFAAHDLVTFLHDMHTEYEEVIITNDPDDPYPWYAFFNNLNPNDFNQSAIKRSDGPWKYENLLFTQKECPSGDVFPGPREKPLERHVLVVDGFKCPVESKIKDGMRATVVKQFKNPDDSVAYTLWEETKE